MSLSSGSSVAALNAATITANSIVNNSSTRAHVGFADAAGSTAIKHGVDSLAKRPAMKVSRSTRMLTQRRQGRSPLKMLDRYRGRDGSSKAGFLSMISAKTAVVGKSAHAASAPMQVSQLLDTVDVGEGQVDFPNRSVSSFKNALLAAVRYPPLRSKTAAVRVGRGGSSGTGCRPSCTRAM